MFGHEPDVSRVTRMYNFGRKAAVAGLLLSGLAAPALAADIAEPPVVEAPAPMAPVYEEADYGGWYIRGDLGYRKSNMDSPEYVLPFGQVGRFDTHELKGGFSVGGGVGYQVTKYFRTDLTLDYWSKTKFNGGTSGFCGTGLPCTSTDTSSYSALLLLANAYVDIGTWHGITPYVGAGIGGANLKWNSLINTDPDGEFEHEGHSSWRFAYALMAGASYCLTDTTKLDVGYRFSHINGGRMFGYRAGGGPGFDDGINTHEVRAGLRYQFGGRSDCAPPPPVYVPEPEPEPVYTK